MIETFLATLSPMLMMFLCIAIGFVLRKTKAVPENTAAVLSKLELGIFIPSLILSTSLEYCTMESMLSQYRIVLYGTAAVALSVAMGIPLARLFSRNADERNIYQYALITANYGFLGNAIVPRILGDEGLYFYLLFCMPLNVVGYAWVLHTLIPGQKGKKQSILRSLMNPPCVALALGALLGMLGVGTWMPGFVTATLKGLTGCMGPVAMILTGFVIGGYRISELLKIRKVWIVTFLRLFVLPGILIGFLWLLGADKLTLILALFAFASALGLNAVVVPAAYGGDTRTGAAMATISHAACIITIPLLYALLQQIL